MIFLHTYLEDIHGIVHPAVLLGGQNVSDSRGGGATCAARLFLFGPMER